MRDAERLQIGHDRSGGVEIEIRRQLQAVGRDRDRRGHFPIRCARAPTMAGRCRPTRCPRSGFPLVLPDAWLMAWSDRLASRRSVAPSPIRQCAVSRPSSAALRLAEGCAREPRDDLALADRQQFSHQRQPLLRRPASSRSSQSSTADCSVDGIERIGDLVAIFRIGPGIFAAAALAHGIGKFALEIAEEREGRLRAPFLAHEQHRDRTAPAAVTASAASIARSVGSAFEPVAERAVADLVVVLQEIDEGGRRQLAARLAARLPPRNAEASP